MALLNKLFFPSATSAPSAPTHSSPTVNNKTSSSSSTASWPSSSLNANSKRQHASAQTVHSKNYLSQFPFDGRQIRVLLYRECDSRGRRLLFDSNALEKVFLKEPNGNSTKNEKNTRAEDRLFTHNGNKEIFSASKHKTDKGHSTNFIEVCDEYGYVHNRPNSDDIASVGGMVFGELALSFRGTAFKVHWLQAPSRILCSQVFLAPVTGNAVSHSPYSTLSMNSLLITPRTSICSEHGSMDGLSINSISMPFSVNVGRHMSLTTSDRSSGITCPLDVPDHQSVSTSTYSGPRFSSTYSTVTDSGYSGMSRSQLSSDQWSASYQYSTRSSLGSVVSEQSDALRKLSLDSSYFSTVPLFADFASDGSLQRRICRNLRTSFEYENSMNDIIGYISDGHPSGNATNGGSEGGNMSVLNYRRASYCANESRSNPEIGKRRDATIGRSKGRRAKLGIAVCITMSESFEEEMELFCSEHVALLESMLSRLRAQAERSYINHGDLLQIMYQAWQETQQWFNDLFTAPRIKCPVWLSITTSGSKYSKNVAERFMKELCWLLSLADTKDTNFFISTMLTAILTYHLGWVSTVSAFNSSSSRTETSTAAIEQRAKLQHITQKFPYCALWAQLVDILGGLGQPPKLARTIIYGTDSVSVERLLNVLTYFIRCGEVRRSAKREDFNKDLVNSLVCQNNNEVLKKSSMPSRKKISEGGLTRTQTCKQNLNTISDSFESEGSSSEEQFEAYVRTLKKNEIPTVLAFRDSRFVQQELRIGNYLMDTGIEKSSLLKNQERKALISKDSQIRLTLTTPDNVEMCVEDESTCCGDSIDDGAVEAIEIDTGDNAINQENTKRISTSSSKKNFFWKMVPPSVKEGVSLDGIEKVMNRRSSSLSNFSESDGNEYAEKRISGLSLSDLITQNSMGKSDRMTWGIEPIKENVSLEEQIHFDFCQKLIEREHGICRNNDNEQGVFFVLGDNEPLVNIKKSTEDLSADGSEVKPVIRENAQQTLCPLHSRTHELTHSKKYSGVKFNFEQYPNIATNYMKSKNLMVSNYDLLMDKCTKLEDNIESIYETNKTTECNVITQAPTTATISCEVCNSILNSYETPSNATELEFETDDVHSFSNMTTPHSSTKALNSVSSGTSIDTLKSTPQNIETISNDDAKKLDTESIPNTPVLKRTPIFSGKPKKVSSHRSSISSVAQKCAAVNDAVHLLKLPVPGIKELPQDDEAVGDMKLRAGFIPSLFLNVNDHYVSDMVLQGTFASPNKWEMRLREDLALAAHSASLISLPAENIAILADMEKWEVRLMSSQSQSFPYAGGQSAPVGMSLLVSSMLETVQAMNNAGISAYECLSFLEAKLQEIYLQSETLAAFLLETDFCPLSVVTAALNLSENDVPLLLSIASMHTPQISKKCGISFR